MGIELIVASAMALLYPAAKHAAGTIAEGFLAGAADNAYASAGKFMKWLKEKWVTNPKGSRALHDVEEDPDDAISRDLLKARLAEAAEESPEFRQELEEQIEQNEAAVRVFISVKQMEDVTGLDLRTFRAGIAEVTIVGDKATRVIGATIDEMG